MEKTLDQLRQSLGLLQVAFDASSEAMVIVEPRVKSAGLTRRLQIFGQWFSSF